MMFNLLIEFKIDNHKYAYAESEGRYFTLAYINYCWELFCSGDGYGYKSLKTAEAAFGNRLFFFQNYDERYSEPVIYVPVNYTQSIRRLRRI